MPIPEIAAGNIVQVTIESQALGQTLLNVLHYRAKIALAGQDYFLVMSNLAEAIGESPTAGIVPKMLPLMGANTSVANIYCQRIAPVRSPFLKTLVDMPGSHVEDCDASNLAAVITKRGDVSGRGRSGTFHLGGLGNTVYGHGFITPGSLTLLEELADKMNDPQLTSGGSSVFEPIIYNPGGGSPGTGNEIVFCGPSNTVRVMRRRTVGLGI